MTDREFTVIYGHLESAQLMPPSVRIEAMKRRGSPIWATGQMLIDTDGTILCAIPLMVDGRMFTLRVKRNDGFSICGFESNDQETSSTAELLQTLRKSDKEETHES